MAKVTCALARLFVRLHDSPLRDAPYVPER